MGCNLCTFQKREEHYKLLYEVCQVSADRRRGRAARLCAGLQDGRGMVPVALFLLSGDSELRAALLVGGFLFRVAVAVFSLLATPPSEDFLWDSL